MFYDDWLIAAHWAVLHLRLYKTRCMAKPSVNPPGAQTCQRNANQTFNSP